MLKYLITCQKTDKVNKDEKRAKTNDKESKLVVQPMPMNVNVIQKIENDLSQLRRPTCN